VDTLIAIPAVCNDLPDQAILCRDDFSTEGLATACATGYYGIVLDMSVIKVCALCPSGERKSARTARTATPHGLAGWLAGCGLAGRKREAAAAANWLAGRKRQVRGKTLRLATQGRAGWLAC